MQVDIQPIYAKQLSTGKLLDLRKGCSWHISEERRLQKDLMFRVFGAEYKDSKEARMEPETFVEFKKVHRPVKLAWGQGELPPVSDAERIASDAHAKAREELRLKPKKKKGVKKGGKKKKKGAKKKKKK